jgi:hypothetical protein
MGRKISANTIKISCAQTIEVNAYKYAMDTPDLAGRTSGSTPAEVSSISAAETGLLDCKRDNAINSNANELTVVKQPDKNTSNIKMRT